MKSENGLQIERVAEILFLTIEDIEQGRARTTELVRLKDGTFCPMSVEALRKKLFHIRSLCIQGAL